MDYSWSYWLGLRPTALVGLLWKSKSTTRKLTARNPKILNSSSLPLFIKLRRPLIIKTFWTQSFFSAFAGFSIWLLLVTSAKSWSFWRLTCVVFCVVFLCLDLRVCAKGCLVLIGVTGVWVSGFGFFQGLRIPDCMA